MTWKYIISSVWILFYFKRKCIYSSDAMEDYASILIYCSYTGNVLLILLWHFCLYHIWFFFSSSENLTANNHCKYDMQCNGTKFARVCNNSRCECQSGYILIGNNCYPGKGSLYLIQVFNVQSLTYTKIR